MICLRVGARTKLHVPWHTGSSTSHSISWDNLGQEAIDQIGELVSAGKGKSITVSHNPEKFSRLQKSLLVICSEPKNGKCDLYMLDEVYDIFKKLTDGHLEMLSNITEQYAKGRLKEMEEASKASEAKLPLNLLPALTSNPPEMPLEGSQVAFKLIRPRVMELTLRLSANRYMVCYFFMQEGYIHPYVIGEISLILCGME